VKKHAHAIASAGCQVHVLSLVIENSTGFYSKEVLKFNDEINIANTQILIRSRFYKFFHLMLFFQKHLVSKAFKEIEVEFKPQLIHSNVLYPAAILGHHLSKKHHLPHVITEHWSKVNEFMQKSLYAGKGKIAYSKAKAITVVSGFLRTRIQSHIDLSKTHLVPNVIRSDVFTFSEKKNNANELQFTAVAHWQKPKRPDLIFRSLNEFARTSSKKIILNVIGEGTLVNELKATDWLFTINYLGNKPAKELASILQNSNYFLHASEIETFSIVIAEALATGTPVLASNKGAIPELINTGNGVLCENTIEDWLVGLKKLTETKFEHKIISENSTKFSETSIGNQFKKIYSEILGV
jgi:glycosyltransferase involved in cell wall biosynthesis